MDIQKATECTSTTTALSTKIPGQSVFFSLTSANALAGGWTAVWRVNTPTFGANAPNAGSVVATCGSTTLTGGTLLYQNDNKHIKYTLPNVGNVATKNKKTGVPTGNTLERATYEPICAAKSKLTVTINDWSPSSETALAETTGDCLVVMAAANHASTTVAE